jgi:hypothetical protein
MFNFDVHLAALMLLEHTTTRPRMWGSNAQLTQSSMLVRSAFDQQRVNA